MGQSRILVIINATIKDAHLDCKASGTGKDAVKVFLVITKHTMFHTALLFIVITHESLKRNCQATVPPGYP